MSDLVFARNCSVARMLPGEAELVSERRGPGVKSFEWSNELATALYKNFPFLPAFRTPFRLILRSCESSTRSSPAATCWGVAPSAWSC